MDSFSEDDFTPEGVSRHIVFLLIAVILVTAIFIPVFWGVTGETVIHENNGPGLGMPMTYDDGNPLGASYTFSVEGTNVNVNGNYSYVVGEGENQKTVSGSYTGSVSMAKDTVLLLTDKSALFVSGGKLIWYDGTANQEVASITLTMENNQINGQNYNWVYLPDSNGTFRAYDSSVPYDTDNKAVGVGYSYDKTIISVNNSATNTNGVVVIVDRTDGGINNISYTWSEIQ